jgi:hypothetical protein
LTVGEHRKPKGAVTNFGLHTPASIKEHVPLYASIGLPQKAKLLC